MKFILHNFSCFYKGGFPLRDFFLCNIINDNIFQGNLSDFNFYLFKIRPDIVHCFLLMLLFLFFWLAQNFGHVNRFHCFDWFAPFFAANKWD